MPCCTHNLGDTELLRFGVGNNVTVWSFSSLKCYHIYCWLFVRAAQRQYGRPSVVTTFPTTQRGDYAGVRRRLRTFNGNSTAADAPAHAAVRTVLQPTSCFCEVPRDVSQEVPDQESPSKLLEHHGTPSELPDYGTSSGISYKNVSSSTFFEMHDSDSTS